MIKPFRITLDFNVLKSFQVSKNKSAFRRMHYRANDTTIKTKMIRADTPPIASAVRFSLFISFL